MRTDTHFGTDRGQAYTLEGFIGAMVVLMALLFALQSVVITPTTGGLADRTVQEQVQQETQDALLVSNQEGNLSEAVRNWDGDGGFEGADNPPAPGEDHDTYSVNDFNNSSDLGGILQDRFADSGWSYNVELHTADGENRTLVYQGSPPSDAVTASYTISLYDNQSVTADSPSEDTLEDAAESGGFDEPIPRIEGDDRLLYNVVEVRVIVW